MSPPIPSLPERVEALEQAFALAQARRLALIVAIHAWLTSDPDATTPQAFNDFKAHLEDAIAQEGP